MKRAFALNQFCRGIPGKCCLAGNGRIPRQRPGVQLLSAEGRNSSPETVKTRLGGSLRANTGFSSKSNPVLARPLIPRAKVLGWFRLCRAPAGGMAGMRRDYRKRLKARMSLALVLSERGVLTAPRSWHLWTLYAWRSGAQKGAAGSRGCRLLRSGSVHWPGCITSASQSIKLILDCNIIKSF